MNANLQEPSQLAEKISLADAKLAKLQQEIDEIGQPAAYELVRRLEALKIEERALKRNFEESQCAKVPNPLKMEKIETLLHHIEREENSMEQDAGFLGQAAPSSMTLAVQAGAHVVDLARQGARRVFGESHPLGSSAFVNHSHEELAKQYGLEENHGNHAGRAAGS